MSISSLHPSRWFKTETRRRKFSPCCGPVEAVEDRVLLSATPSRVATVEVKPNSNGLLPQFAGTWLVDSVVDGKAFFTQNENVVNAIHQGNDGLFIGTGTIKGNGTLVFKTATVAGIPARAKLTLILDDINTVTGHLKVKLLNLGKINAPLTATRVP